MLTCIAGIFAQILLPEQIKTDEMLPWHIFLHFSFSTIGTDQIGTWFFPCSHCSLSLNTKKVERKKPLHSACFLSDKTQLQSKQKQRWQHRRNTSPKAARSQSPLGTLTKWREKPAAQLCYQQCQIMFEL